MRVARISLLACGLLLACLQAGQTQTPPAPLTAPSPASPTPTTLPIGGTLPPTNVETPLPGSEDTQAFAGDPAADPYKSIILGQCRYV